jgi:CHAD domain-containing protein
MVSFEEGTLMGKDIEYLHDMRVASRRVQAMMKIFRGAFPKRIFRAEYDKIRTLIRTLGVVRDSDVFIDKIEKYKKVLKDYDNRALDLLIHKKMTQREEKRRIMILTINSLNKKGYKESFMRFITTNL